jgi:hypothetical protein
MKKIYTLIFVFISVTAFAQQKFALVIGNGNYTNTTKLNNPVNDANDMANALQGLGFTVDKLLNGTQDQMVSAIMRLKNRLSLSKNSYGFLFYAGHGVQSNGENYLIPVDANIPSENFLRNRTVSVQEMLDELNDAGNEFNVVVLDACRDNPFSWRRSGSRGLTVVGHQPADSIIVYATSAGSTASDGTGRNGFFTTHLLNNLKTPNLEVTEMLRRTNADVARASNNQQRLAVYNQFYGTAYLGTRPIENTPVQPNPIVNVGSATDFYGRWTTSGQNRIFSSTQIIGNTDNGESFTITLTSVTPVINNGSIISKDSYPSGFTFEGKVTAVSGTWSVELEETVTWTYYMSSDKQKWTGASMSVFSKQ